MSPAKIEANRANAAHSTGPRTEQGKAHSAQNATSHGLTAAYPLVLAGEETEFDALREGLTLSIQPEGTLEQVYFSRLVHASWNLRRCDLVEASGNGDPLEASEPAIFQRAIDIDLYRTRAERTLFRCTRELRILQQERTVRGISAAQNYPVPSETVELVAPMASLPEVTKQTQPPSIEKAIRSEFRAIDRQQINIIGQARAGREAAAPEPAGNTDEPNEPTTPAPSAATYRRDQPKTGRNEPCPCASGLKYKRCCGR